jgi:hypothetical protein
VPLGHSMTLTLSTVLLWETRHGVRLVLESIIWSHNRSKCIDHSTTCGNCIL